MLPCLRSQQSKLSLMQPERKDFPVSGKIENMTFSFDVIEGAVFPDMGVDIFVDGKPTDKFMGSCDGKKWRVTLLNFPSDAQIEIKKKETGSPVETLRVGIEKDRPDDRDT